MPGGETGAEIAGRVAGVLDDLADRHRGETVLVVAHGGAILATLSVVAWRARAHRGSTNCAFAVLERDVDGWRLASRPARARVRLGNPNLAATICGCRRRKGKVKQPKSKCCVSKDRCKRCPIRMLKEGTLPAGYTRQEAQAGEGQAQEGRSPQPIAA